MLFSQGEWISVVVICDARIDEYIKSITIDEDEKNRAKRVKLRIPLMITELQDVRVSLPVKSDLLRERVWNIYQVPRIYF